MRSILTSRTSAIDLPDSLYIFDLSYHNAKRYTHKPLQTPDSIRVLELYQERPAQNFRAEYSRYTERIPNEFRCSVRGYFVRLEQPFYRMLSLRCRKRHGLVYHGEPEFCASGATLSRSEPSHLGGRYLHQPVG